MIKIKKLAVVAACVLAGTLALVGCSQDVELDNGDTQDKDYPVVEAPKPLPLVVGYDKLTLHGKYRQYKVDTSKGDSLTEYSDGSPTGKYPIPAGAIKNGVEYPTFWSRLPLSIQPNNDDQTKGLYSIHKKGTSAIFPKSLDTSYKDREKDANSRQATAGVYIALRTTSPSITFRYNYIMKGYNNAGSRAFSGIDIYELENGSPTFKKNLRDTVDSGEFEYETGASDTAAVDLIVMLPTYNGFEVKADDVDNPSGLTLVFEEGSETYEIEPFNESTQKPILIYGTSITQGDGASGLRPGAAYAAQIMWATGREVINLGVAGSAQMEYKMADFLSNIESSVFIMDPGWNLTSGAVSDTYCTANGSPANITNKEIVARAKYMVTTYRAKHPNTPIIMCPQFLKSGDAKKTNEWQSSWSSIKISGKEELDPELNITKPDSFPNGYYYGRPGLLLYTAYTELIKEGVKNLYWAEQGLTGTTGDKYVSGSDLHPPINGMTDIANFILNCIDTNVPSVEVVTELPLSYLAQ